MSTVTYDHVVKRFGEVIAVNDLDLQVRDGEFLVLVGPSGCGKTTALRMLAGLEEQTSGDIYIGDRLVNDTAPKDRDIAMVFQNYALYPHMSVYDNIAFGLRLRGTPRAEIERRVTEVAEILGLAQLLHQAAHPDESGAGEDPPARRQDDHLRHPRPGRDHDHGRSPFVVMKDERFTGRSCSSHRGADLLQQPSWPASSARRR